MVLNVTDEVAAAAERATASRWFERMARLGYAAKGVVFTLIGILAARVALGSSHENADATGAIETIGDQPLSMLLLVLLALGLTAYSLWRLAQGILDVENHGRDARAWFSRSTYVGIGLSYASIAVLCVMVLTGWRRGNDDGVEQVTALALQLPLGAWLVGVAGGVVILAGLREAMIAVTGRFKKEFAQEKMSGAERVAARWIGWYGHVARGVGFVIAGILAMRAAVDYDPDEAGGLADAFREIAEQPHGSIMLLAVAAGFVAFGVYCGLLAVHRHMPMEEETSAR